MFGHLAAQQEGNWGRRRSQSDMPESAPQRRPDRVMDQSRLIYLHFLQTPASFPIWAMWLLETLPLTTILTRSQNHLFHILA